MAEFIYDIEKRNEWINRFEQQKEHIQSLCYDGEMIAQCLDAESFDGRYYNPMWVVTSEARIYSLHDRCFLKPSLSKQGKPNKDGEYNALQRYYLENSWEETTMRLNLVHNAKVYIHNLVAVYFVERPANFDETWKAHHVFGYYHLYDLEKLKSRQNYEARWEDCRWNNRAEHLNWVKDSDHTLMNYIQRKKKLGADTILQRLEKGITYQKRPKGIKVEVEDGLTEEIVKIIIDNGRYNYGQRKLWNAIGVQYNKHDAAKYYVKATFTGENPPYL